jgi:hypothetical protein
MNKAISLVKLIEEASYLQDANTKNLAGSITDPALFDQNRRALQSMHRGLYSFMAFHPNVDRSVAEYIEAGSIGSDSGQNILVLFFSTKELRFPRKINQTDLNVGFELDPAVHPAYEFAQWLLPGQVAPKFPGIFFMDRVVDSIEALYVPITKHETPAEVADFCRSVFLLAIKVLKRDSQEPFSFDSFATTLMKSGFEYQRTSEASVGEWMISGYRFSKKYGATIVSIISKVAKLV